MAVEATLCLVTYLWLLFEKAPALSFLCPVLGLLERRELQADFLFVQRAKVVESIPENIFNKRISLWRSYNRRCEFREGFCGFARGVTSRKPGRGPSKGAESAQKVADTLATESL